VTAAGGDPGATTMLLILVAGSLWYAIACVMFPFTKCWRCQRGRIRSSGGRTWRRCRRCKGSGERLRGAIDVCAASL